MTERSVVNRVVAGLSLVRGAQDMEVQEEAGERRMEASAAAARVLPERHKGSREDKAPWSSG